MGLFPGGDFVAKPECALAAITWFSVKPRRHTPCSPGRPVFPAPSSPRQHPCGSSFSAQNSISYLRPAKITAQRWSPRSSFLCSLSQRLRQDEASLQPGSVSEGKECDRQAQNQNQCLICLVKRSLDRSDAQTSATALAPLVDAEGTFWR